MTMWNFVEKNFNEYFKSIREKQDFRKVAELLYVFLTKFDEKSVHHGNMCYQILLIVVYIGIMLRFWILLIQNYNQFAQNQKLIKRIVKWVEKGKSSDNISRGL